MNNSINFNSFVDLYTKANCQIADSFNAGSASAPLATQPAHPKHQPFVPAKRFAIQEKEDRLTINRYSYSFF